MALEVLFPSFVEYTKKYFPEEIQVRNRMREYADLRLPQLLFPDARKRKRKASFCFILLLGSTIDFLCYIRLYIILVQQIVARHTMQWKD